MTPKCSRPLVAWTSNSDDIVLAGYLTACPWGQFRRRFARAQIPCRPGGLLRRAPRDAFEDVPVIPSLVRAPGQSRHAHRHQSSGFHALHLIAE